MHRCFCDPAGWGDRSLRLGPDESHHLLHVLRATPGTRVLAFDGRGREALAELRRIEGGAGGGGTSCAVLEWIEEHAAPSLPVRLTLVQAIPKPARMDLIVEKATELGVDRIVPVVTDRVVVRPEPGKADSKLSRWRRIAQAACRQCGRARLPEITSILTLEQALGLVAVVDRRVVGSLAESARPLWDVAAEVCGPGGGSSVALLIGPEGDWTPAELERIRQSKATEVTFGPQVLRVETAALFGLSVLVSATAARPAARPSAGEGR